jgi:hypothetical protein
MFGFLIIVLIYWFVIELFIGLIFGISNLPV